MIRNLLVISGASLVLALVGIGGSLAIGGADLARHSFTWVIDGNGDGIDIRRTNAADVPAQSVTRQIAWIGQDRLSITLPGEVLYIQTSENPGITLSGPQALIDRVSLQDGQLILSDHAQDEQSYLTLGRTGLREWKNTDGLKVTIRAPSVKSFELSGNTDLTVRGYNQPSLNLLIMGNADARVSGRTEELTVDVSGSTNARLSELITTNANLRASGNGDITTAANGKVMIEGSGNTSVRLTRRPLELTQTLTGESSVEQD